MNDIEITPVQLGESETCNKYLGFTAKEWHEENVRLKEGLEKALADYMIERDRWKIYAEALIKAIKQLPSACYICKYQAKPSDWSCGNPNGGCKNGNCIGWQFDEARFAKLNDGSVV